MAALAQGLPECRISGHEAGLHLLLELPEGAVGSEITAAAERRGMALCDVTSARSDGTADELRIPVG